MSDLTGIQGSSIPKTTVSDTTTKESGELFLSALKTEFGKVSATSEKAVSPEISELRELNKVVNAVIEGQPFKLEFSVEHKGFAPRPIDTHI